MGASYDDNTAFAEDACRSAKIGCARGCSACARAGEASLCREGMAPALKKEAMVTQKFNALRRRRVEAAPDAELVMGTDYRLSTME